MKRNINIILLALVFLNLFIFLNRNNGFRYTPCASRAKLYNTDASLMLSRLLVKNGLATLQFAKPCIRRSGMLFVDSVPTGKIVKLNKSGHVEFALKEGVHLYEIRQPDETKNTIAIKLDHFKDADVEAELQYTTLLEPDVQYTPMKVWINGSKDFHMNDLDKARRFLDSVPGWREAMTDLSKVKIIASACAGICSDKGPIKFPESLLQFSALRQLSTIQSCNTQFNCGAHTLLFYFFCTAAGLPVRGISVGGISEFGWQYAVHFYNEVYLREENSWCFFDGLANLILPNDGQGRYYSALDLHDMARAGSIPGDAIAFYSSGDSLLKQPLKFYKSHLLTYFSNSSRINFHHPGVSMNKSFIQRAIEFYSIPEHDNIYCWSTTNNYVLIYLKLAALYLLGGVVIILVLLRILPSYSLRQ